MTHPAAEALPELRVLPAGEVGGEAAAFIARTLAAAIAERGVAHWATTGGSAAPEFYRALVAPGLRDGVDWSRVHAWWGDDRFVPPDDPLSNVRPLDEVLLATGSGVRIPDDHRHPVPVAEALARGAGPEWAAARYAGTLRELARADAFETPVLDLVVLGVGPDGHILSVFPDSRVWDDDAMCCAVPAPTHVEPHVARVTMHPRVIAAAGTVLVVASGASKAAALGRAWTGDDVRELPVRVARIRGATWLLDEAAAAEIARG